VTCHEVRTHLGVETQRQWADQAITRTTPALLDLFWYAKSTPTFSDALAIYDNRFGKRNIFRYLLHRAISEKSRFRNFSPGSMPCGIPLEPGQLDKV